jgi:hypothetical protein
MIESVPAFLPTDTAYTCTPFIEMYTGRQFYPLEPVRSRNELSVIDIAHHLSNQCRYSGAVRYFYSTAQHCVLLAQWAVKNGKSPLEALQILLHDAPEAYLVDIPRPVKQFMPEYRKWDHAINDVIREWMGWSGIPIPSFQDEIDTRIVVDERAALLHKDNVWQSDGLEPLGVVIERWTPERAEKEFLLHYAAYSKAVYGSYQYLNDEWGVPVKIFHQYGGDVRQAIEVVEVDVRGGVAGVRVRDEGGYLIRDGDSEFPRALTEWKHGKFEVVERGTTS